MKNIKFLILGALFGFILYKTEVISWFRIQEMFLFESFHMYGVIISAIVTAAIIVFIIKKMNIKAINGNKVALTPKSFTKGNIIGGMLFGMGWTLTGACPGPLYALIGSGYWVVILALLSAILGTFVYGLLKEKLPH